MESSNEYIKTTRRLIRENADLFEALLEFERTKKLPKLSRKRRVNITIESSLLREIHREANKRGVKLSPLIEQKLREQLREWRKS